MLLKTYINWNSHTCWWQHRLLNCFGSSLVLTTKPEQRHEKLYSNFIPRSMPNKNVHKIINLNTDSTWLTKLSSVNLFPSVIKWVGSGSTVSYRELLYSNKNEQTIGTHNSMLESTHITGEKGNKKRKQCMTSFMNINSNLGFWWFWFWTATM